MFYWCSIHRCGGESEEDWSRNYKPHTIIRSITHQKLIKLWTALHCKCVNKSAWLKQEKWDVKLIRDWKWDERCHSLEEIKEDKYNVISVSAFCAVFELQHVQVWATDDENCTQGHVLLHKPAVSKCISIQTAASNFKPRLIAKPNVTFLWPKGNVKTSTRKVRPALGKTTCTCWLVHLRFKELFGHS